MKTKINRKVLPYLNTLFLCVLSVFLASCGGSKADYGDAPDGGATGYPDTYAQAGQFPSLFASDGARTLDISKAWMGPGVTEENDAQVVNLDTDDSLTNFYTTLTSIPPPTTMSVNVTGTETGDYFFNALIDLNMDGKWGGATGAGGETEWVVQNLPVNVIQDVVTPVTSPPFAFTNGLLVPDRAWMRIALTKEQVPQDWDGTGEFSKGEIEDFPIMPPIVGGKEIPMVQVDCGGPYSFGGNNQIQVMCTVTNLRNVAGTFTHAVVHAPNGGTVDVDMCMPANPVAIGAALLPNGNPNPDASKVITCTATKGNTPDAWTFKATVVDPDFFFDPYEPRFGQDETAEGFWVFSASTTEVPFELSVSDVQPGPVFYEQGVGTTIPVIGQFNGPASCFPPGVTASISISNTSTGGDFDILENFPVNENGGFSGEAMVGDFFGPLDINVNALSNIPQDCVLQPGDPDNPSSFTLDVPEPEPGDTTPPVITLNGSSTVNLEVGDSYTDAGATANDAVDGAVEVTTSGNVNTVVAGTYTITYSAVDAAGNSTSKTREVVVTEVTPVDTTPPVITLNGDSIVNLEVGESYTDAGATANDNKDGNVAVTTSGIVNTAAAGTYTITYSAVDAAGNSTSETRQVVVTEVTPVDTTAPVITLNGSSLVLLEVGESYTDEGATANDNKDGDVAVTTSGTVNTAVPGTYTITYSAVDDAGNSSSETRNVVVTDFGDVVVTGGPTLSVTHTIEDDDEDSSPCPQDVGTVVVTNNTASPVPLEINIPQGVALETDPATGTMIAKGESVTVKVFFLCDPRGVLTDITVNGETISVEVNVVDNRDDEED